MTERRIPGAAAVDQAINQVLAAEREASEAVARCRAEAERIRTAAEERARALAERTERRIQVTHWIADRAVERALAELRERGTRQADRTREALDDAHLERALDALVEEIVGAEP